MNFETLGPHVSNPRVFFGAETCPFLAPRGVFLHGNQLFVADTGQNRVFIWNTLPEEKFADPAVVLGQQDIEQAGRNAGGVVSASTLHYPSGIWSDGRRLIVADAWNHRVLIWLSIPSTNGQPADVVLGQPDFESNLPNVEGIGKAPSARSFNWSYGVYSDGTHLWVADTGNRRILYFDQIPATSYVAADQVIGKPDFTTRDYYNHEPIWPYSVKVSPKGQILVADTQFYRVLLWHNMKAAVSGPANLIIGQEHFDACGQNQYGLQPSPKSLNWTYDACFYREGLMVTDTGNSRVLWYDQVPEQHSPVAQAVIGKRDFTTGSENKDTLFGTDSSLYWPFSTSIDQERMVMADTGNHRVILAQLLL